MLGFRVQDQSEIFDQSLNSSKNSDREKSGNNSAKQLQVIQTGGTSSVNYQTDSDLENVHIAMGEWLREAFFPVILLLSCSPCSS